MLFKAFSIGTSAFFSSRATNENYIFSCQNPYLLFFLSLLRITKHDIPKGLVVVVVILVVVIVDMVVIVVVDWTHVLGPEMKLLKSVSIVAPLFRMQSPLDQNDQT